MECTDSTFSVQLLILSMKLQTLTDTDHQSNPLLSLDSEDLDHSFRVTVQNNIYEILPFLTIEKLQASECQENADAFILEM